MRKRKNRIQVRLSDKEFQLFEKQVAKTKLTKESYLRALMAGHTPKEAPCLDFYSLMKQVSAIGNNMNQIAFRLNAIGSFDQEEYKKNVEQLQGAIHIIMKEVTEPQSNK